MEAMKKRTKKQAAWKATALWVGVVITAAFGFGIYQYKTAGWDFSALSASLARVKIWVNDHKTKPHMEARAKLTKPSSAEPPLHFEFYTALPNMQLAVAETAPDAPSVKTEIKVRMQEPKPVAKLPIASKANLIKPTTAIVTADELERELSGHIKLAAHALKEQFAIQVGVFRSIEAAKHYQETLRKTGFKTAVAPLGSDKKNLYRVQLGPYADKSQANLSWHQLEAQGIKGVIYKLNK